MSIEMKNGVQKEREEKRREREREKTTDCF